MALAVGMAVAGNMASFTASNKDLPEGNYGGVIDGDTNSVLAGTIEVANVQVEVPIKASFDIDPSVTVTVGGTVVTSLGADGTNQVITQASNYTITDTSKVPLIISITGVRMGTGGGTTEDTPKLVNTMDELTGISMMFAICKNGDSIIYPAAGANNTGKWMAKIAVTTGSSCSIAETPNDDILAPEGTLNITLCGATGASWKNGQSFRMIPAFTVALQSS